MITIISRESLPKLTQAEQSGNIVDIGEYRSFSGDSILKNFLSSTTIPSIAWTKLDPEQMLPVHKHPMDSLIVVCEGSGKYIGEYEKDLIEGDMVHVSSNSLHGFVAGKHGLKCLSIQNDGEPIYNIDKTAKVDFLKQESDHIFLRKDEFENRFTSICETINEAINFGQNEDFENRFFGYLKRWSQCFQRLIFIRQAITYDEGLLKIFYEHLQEEIGHEQILSKYNYEKDMTIESYCSWFEEKIKAVNDHEKAIMIHSVLEAAGEIFSKSISTDTKQTKNYIDLHSDLDEGHSKVCDSYIIDYSINNSDSTENIYNETWIAFITMFEYFLSKCSDNTAKNNS